MSSMLKTTMLLGLLTGLIMMIGGMMGGRGGLEIAFVFAIGMNFFSYWFSDKMVLRAYGAQPLDATSAPDLYGIVNELANAANIPLEVLHRIASMASGGMDTLPHNGAVITLLAVTGLTHKTSYMDIFAITIIKTLAVAVAIVMYSATGIY